MATARQYLAEVVRAGLVLALVLFALGGPLPDQQVGASPAVTASIVQSVVSDLCGGGWGDRQATHAPCHACRAGIPALPPPPATAEPAFRDHCTVAYGIAAPVPVPGRATAHPTARGPPTLA